MTSKISNIILFDLKDDFISEAKRLEKYGIRVVQSDVLDLDKNFKFNVIV